MKTKILHEDAHLLVIHKPSGIAVQSAKIGQMDVESELKNYFARQKKTGFVGLVHRLDQPVEGVLVVAATKNAAAKLNGQLVTGSLNKKYLAVIHLEKEEIQDSGTFVDKIIKEGQVARIVSAHSEKEAGVSEAKEARLQYRILQKQGDIALADVEIETGRFHQIRCQMAYHGMPLLGDTKYGSSTSQEISQTLGVRQVALCANRIAFKHPVTGKELSFEVKPENKAFSKFQ